MNIEDETNRRAAVRCPKCKAVLSEGSRPWLRTAHLTFPDDLNIVYLAAAGRAGYILCPRCKYEVEKPTAVSCVFRGLNRGLLYVPPEVERILPSDTLSRLAQERWKEKERDPLELVLQRDLLLFRRNICEYVGQIVLPLLNQYNVASAQDQELTWIKENLDRLDLGFFSGLWLLGQPFLPDGFHWQLRETSAPPLQAENLGHSSVITQDDVREMVRDQLPKLLRERLMYLAVELANDEALHLLHGPVKQLIPGEALSEEFVSRFRAAVSTCDTHWSNLPKLQYALHAVFASVCRLAEKSNPQARRWTELYVDFEGRARTDPNGFGGIRVTQNFAAETVDMNALWVISAEWMNKLRSQQLSPSDGESAAASLRVVFDLVHAFGWDEQWAEYLLDRTVTSFERVSDEELDAILNNYAADFQSNPLTLYLYFLALQRELLKRDHDRLREFVQRVRLAFVEAGMITEAIWVTVRLSEQWNNLGMTSAALEEVHTCKRDLEAKGLWPPAKALELSMLLSEEASCLRYQGDLATALELYEQISTAMPADLANRDVRENERNRAIVLRDLGHFGESLGILHTLLQHGSERESISTLHSITVCYLTVGRYPDAADCLELALDKVARQRLQASDIAFKLLVTAATVELRQQNYQRGFECARSARKVARDLGSPWQEAIASVHVAWALLNLGGDRDEILATVADTFDLLANAEGARSDRVPNAFTILHVRHMLALLLWKLGEPEGAEKTLEKGIPLFHQDYSNQVWKFWLTLAQLASQRGDAALARQRLLEAYRIVLRETDRVAPADDPIGLMQDKDALQFELTRELLEAYRPGTGGSEDLRLAADFQASVLLSRQLSTAGRRSANFPGPLGHPDLRVVQESNEFEVALEILSYPQTDGASVVQFFRTSDEIRLLVTTLSDKNQTAKGGKGGARTELAAWVAPHVETVDLAAEAWNRLARCSPSQVVDPLAGFAEWEDFAARLRSAVKPFVRPGAHLCLIPGALSVMPLQYVFGADHPLSYAPSLVAASSLRFRHMQLSPEGVPWRPKNLYDFVVWKAGEPEENVDEFKEGAAALQKAIEPFGCTYDASVGIQATRQELFDALTHKDSMRLSCHGRGDARNSRFDLLVACQGQLPPGHPTLLSGAFSEPFLVSWQELSKLQSTPPIVFSTACASGLTASVRGGERIGLERSLLRAGTFAYVAPQWKVPISAIQPFVNRVIVEYLRTPERTLAQTVFDVTAAAISEGISLRVARSLMVHGDWL
jgi:tetratricopeptide (TPR) repeat protein